MNWNVSPVRLGNCHTTACRHMLQKPLQTMHPCEDESTNCVLENTLPMRKAETEFFSFSVASAYNSCRMLFASWNKKLMVSVAIVRWHTSANVNNYYTSENFIETAAIH